MSYNQEEDYNEQAGVSYSQEEDYNEQAGMPQVKRGPTTNTPDATQPREGLQRISRDVGIQLRGGLQ